jgi:hypothetical protein
MRVSAWVHWWWKLFFHEKGFLNNWIITENSVLRWTGTKETSFLYAISSAGLVHEFSRACSQGTLDRCTCDESNPEESKKSWLWGGCGDNIDFGVRFTRRFLKKGHKSGMDIRARVDQHNSRVGIRVSVQKLPVSPFLWHDLSILFIYITSSYFFTSLSSSFT